MKVNFLKKNDIDIIFYIIHLGLSTTMMTRRKRRQPSLTDFGKDQKLRQTNKDRNKAKIVIRDHAV